MGDSEFVRHEPCPKCGSKDNLAVYSDNHRWCFGCGYREDPSGSPQPVPPKAHPDLIPISDQYAEGLGNRKLSEESCKLWKCLKGTHNGKPCLIANYLVDGQAVAQKLRFPGKDFKFLKATQKVPFYGQWLWKSEGKMVVVTEGELDAISVSQVQDHKWPVVSIPNGCQGAAKSFRENIEFLLGFDHVVIMFDNDEPGQKAAIECAQVLPPGRAKIASLALKDPSDLLKAGRGGEIIQAIWNAKVYRPDGILAGEELWTALEHHVQEPCWEYPWPSWNAKLDGAEKGGYVLVLAGTGVGKSTFMRAVALHLIHQKETVGMLMLEESPEESLRELLRAAAKSRTESDLGNLKPIFQGIQDRLFLYDHRGESDPETVLKRVEYLIKGCGCGFVVIDNLTVILASMDGDDERKQADRFVQRLQSILSNGAAGAFLVNHVNSPEGNKGPEDGAQVRLKQSRGSRGPANLARTVISLERNQSAGDNRTVIRSLKCRRTGNTGIVGAITFNAKTGELLEDSGYVFERQDESSY